MKIETADEEAERVQGLSGRDSLCSKCGILFVYDQPTFIRIWMKDMKFSLDIIWFDENFDVIRVEENAGPESYPKIFYPEKEAKYVLEVNTGFIKENNVHLGDEFHFQ